MLTKTKAIVLRKLKYGDGQIIVDMLTKDMGRVSFICRLPKTPRGQIKRQFFMPLSILDIEMDYRQNRQLQHLRNIAISFPTVGITVQPDKIAIALFIAEFLTAATTGERQPDDTLFNYIEASIKWINDAVSHYANFHLVLMMRLKRFIGFFPNLEKQDEGEYFDLRGGCFTDVKPFHEDFLKPQEAAQIGTIMRMDFANMRFFHLTRDERNRCCDIILKYYQLHVPSFPELNSTAVVRELFS